MDLGAFGLMVCLATVSAQGAVLNQAECDARLEAIDRAPASPADAVVLTRIGCPILRNVPLRYDVWTCPRCGQRTTFPTEGVFALRERLAGEAARLRALGLDIALEEVEPCAVCSKRGFRVHPERGIHLPSGRIVHFRGRRADGWYALFPHQRLPATFWLPADNLSEQGVVVVREGESRWVDLRHDASRASPGGVSIAEGTALKRLPAQPGDPPDWVRVEVVEYHDALPAKDVRVTRQVTVGVGDLGPVWRVYGRRIPYERGDVELLRAFLRNDGIHEGRPLRERLPRLRRLLQGVAPEACVIEGAEHL